MLTTELTFNAYIAGDQSSSRRPSIGCESCIAWAAFRMASGGPAVPPPGEMEAIANGDSVFRQGVLKGRGYIVTGA